MADLKRVAVPEIRSAIAAAIILNVHGRRVAEMAAGFFADVHLTSRKRYKVLTSFVLPRPIAWATTVGPTDVVNAAFVVNIADEPLARAMYDSSGDFPPEIGEPGYLGLRLAPSTKVAVPRLADVMGEGVNFYIREELWDGNSMRVHMDGYHPVGRMFADRYCRTDDRMEFPPAQGAPAA